MVIDNNMIKDKVTVEILISTMNRTSLSFLNAMFPHHNLDDLNLLVVNQTTQGHELFSEKENIRVLNVYEAGLSKSRNLAIENAMGDICVIADDDVEYLPDFIETLLDSFSQIIDASVILFKIETFSKKAYKQYPSKSKRIFSNKGLTNASSIEIAFKRLEIVQSNVKFNVLFGLGSRFKSGEEYLFLKGLLKKGMVIWFQNKFLVKHSIKRSTSHMESDEFIRAQSAVYYDDYKYVSYLYLFKFIFFLVRKKMITLKLVPYKLNIGFQAISEYKEILNNGN